MAVSSCSAATKFNSVLSKFLNNGCYARAFIALSISLIVCVLAAYADADLRLPRVIAASGGPYIARNNSIERFTDSIKLPAEYASHPLSMVCTNGSETEPGFSWVRMFLIPDGTDQDLQSLSEPVGRLLVNEDSFLSSARIYLDLSSQLKSGSTKIFIEGAGRPGAQFSWEIRSIGNPELYMPQVSSTACGEWLDIRGHGFSLRPDENTVQVGMVRLPVGQASSTILRVFIPKEMQPGPYDLCVSIRTYRSNVVKLQLRAPAKQGN